MQYDVQRRLQSIRRVVSAGRRAPGPAIASWIGIAGAAAILGATMLSVVFTGSVWQPLASLLPSADVAQSLGASFLMFLLGTAVWLVLIAVVSGVLFARARRRMA